ncbi:hypothetical protein SDC9_79512 [bioreactor metagenome]|uniref:Uncharacterized protein n=1 Tax=bioreactor metagenome TaxID=1076179 RepID=A0A644YWG1_9ZZZZ
MRAAEYDRRKRGKSASADHIFRKFRNGDGRDIPARKTAEKSRDDDHLPADALRGDACRPRRILGFADGADVEAELRFIQQDKARNHQRERQPCNRALAAERFADDGSLFEKRQIPRGHFVDDFWPNLPLRIE